MTAQSPFDVVVIGGSVAEAIHGSVVDERRRRVDGCDYDVLLVLCGWTPNIDYAGAAATAASWSPQAHPAD